MDAEEVERTLLSQKAPGLLPPDEGWVVPHYGGLSIANLPATIAALFGVEAEGLLSPLPRQLWADWAPGIRRIALIALDGLGYRRLQASWTRAEPRSLSRLVSSGRLIPLTSVFPSTTAAALVSLYTGCSPAEHGWLAWEMYLREMGVAAVSLLLTPIWSKQRDLLVEWGLRIESLIHVAPLAQRLAEARVEMSALVDRSLDKSGFSQMLYRKVAHVHPHDGAADLAVHLREWLVDTQGQRAMLTAYWPGLDSMGHTYGPEGDHWDAELRLLDYLLDQEVLGRLPEGAREGALLLITADHGQIHVPASGTLTAGDDAELSQHLLVPPMGEARAAFLYPRPGRKEIIRHYLEDCYEGWFVVLDSAQALEAGLMGRPVADESYARAGELLVLPRGDRALQRRQPTRPMQGRHGGLTEQEMLVPLIGIRLDAGQ